MFLVGKQTMEAIAIAKSHCHGPSYRRQVVHSRPQTPQGESNAKPGIPQLIILSIVGKSHIEEVQGNSSNPFLLKDSPCVISLGTLC